MNEALGSIIINHLMTQIERYQASIFSGMTGGFHGFTRTFVTLYIVLIGYRVLMGKTGERAKEWAISAVLLVVLQGVLFESRAYSEWITEPVKSTMFSLAALMSGGGDDAFAAFGRLDQVMLTITQAVDRLDPGGNFLTNTMAYLKVAVASLLLLAFTGGLYLVYLVLIGLALFAVYILFIIGPPFLFFAVFTETRFIAWAWVKALAQYALWFVLLSLVMGIGIEGIEMAGGLLSNWDVVRDGVFTKQYAMTLLMCALVGYFLLKVSDISSALTGGIGMQSGLAGGMLAAGTSGIVSIAGTIGRSSMAAAAASAGPTASVAGYATGRAASAATGGFVRAYSALRGINN